MKISQAGLDAIKRHEGLRLTAYHDPASGGDPWTIGYGHTRDVQRGQTITKEQAEQFLREDLAWVETCIERNVVAPLTQGQYDALCSLIFNIGQAAFTKSTLMRLLNQRDYAGAAAQFERWNIAAGQVNLGLTNRRAAERAMFLSDAIDTSPEPVEKTAPDRHDAPAGDPTQYSQEGGMPIPALAAPFLMGLANSLITGFAPLVQEKISKELNRHTDKPEIGEQIAATLVEGAKTMTGKANPVAAVAAALEDPAAMKKLESDALADLGKMIPLLERLNAMEQANIRSAREYNAAEPLIVDTPWLKLRFVHLLSVFFVTFSGWFVTQNWALLTPELRGSVVMLMMIAGWNGVRDYHMGSSSGSDQKTEMLVRNNRTPAP